MAKDKVELLAAYKKASKPRRLVIIGQTGCSSEEEYFKYLDTLYPTAVAVPSNDGELDMVIAFDTTGSMNIYLNEVRNHVKELIPKLFADNPNLKMKIVAFGDYCDMTSPQVFGNAYQESLLTNDQNILINFVNGAQSTSGGDSDEFYELVIKKITEETPWRATAKKAVLLIADFYPHTLGYSYERRVSYASPVLSFVKNNQIDWREEASKSAAIGVQWDTISCGHAAVDTFYKPLSQMTDGVHIPFKSSKYTQDAIFAATAVRGSSMSKARYSAGGASALLSGDDELIGVYKSLSSKL